MHFINGASKLSPLRIPLLLWLQSSCAGAQDLVFEPIVDALVDYENRSFPWTV